MARDVEVNVTANDKTGNALASAERRFKKTADNTKRESDKMGSNIGKGLVSIIETFAPKLAGTITKAVGSAGEASGPLLVGGIAAASPLVAATISAAIAAGVGVGVAGIGVALVSQDAKVQAAGKQLGTHLMEALQQDASPFITPVLTSIDKIETKFDALRPRIQNIFKNASGFVDPLVNGALRGVDGILRGVDKLVAKSQPVIDNLGEALGDLGQDFGDFLGSIDAEAAANSIKDLATQISGLLAIVGPTLNGLTKLYGFLNDYAPGALTVIGKLTKDQGTFSQRTAGQVDTLGNSFQKATEDTTDYAQTLKDAEAAVRGVYQANNDLYSSTTSVAQAFADANKAAKENGKTLDVNTEKGRNNREALSSVASALQRNYDSYVKVNGAGAGASALASTLRSKFVALAEKMGASSKQAQALANKLLGIPNVNRKVNVATEQARANAEALKKKLEGIKDRSVYVNVAFNQGRINKVEAQLNRLGSHQFDATQSFAFAGADAGVSRTGGPTPVNVNSTVQNVINLDGKPFRQMASKAVRDDRKRQDFRTKVGQR